jgi:hypothetical protein
LEGDKKVPSQCPLVLLLEAVHMIRINFYMTLEGRHYSEIWSKIGRATVRRNFDVTSGRTACEANNTTWNLGTN